MRRILFFSTVLTLAAFVVSAQNRVPAFEMNERLGRGINMGNAFEAPTEAEWGNPWKPEYFRIMRALGFKHVRLPVRWETPERSLATAPYTINADFLDRIQLVVDSALKNDLHIIVNMHHHEALYEDPAGQKARFLSQWSQIAERFKEYPDKLLFEVLNEPHGNVTPAIWNAYFADALAEIRKTNPTRVVLLGVADYGGLGSISQLQLPNDEYIILSPHYYNPFHFTHQGADWVDGADAWLGTEWKDTEADRATVESEFSYALAYSAANHIPVHVGEFGSINIADMASRERWTTFLARWFEEKHLSWAYWEFSAGFGIYNPTTKEYVTPLVNALLHNPMPEPTPVFAKPIYTSNFATGVDGWALSTQGGAAGTLTISGGKLQATLTNGGTETWHIQLVRNNIPLERGKLYQVSFKAQAAADRTATFYLGKNSDPWNAYSGYNGISVSTLESAFTFSFTMTDPTDPAARVVFDLGKSTSGFMISDFKVEELSFTDNVTEVEEELTRAGSEVYPNPVTTFLYIKDHQQYKQADVFDMYGRSWHYAIDESAAGINFERMPAGMYVLKLIGNKKEERIKVVKR